MSALLKFGPWALLVLSAIAAVKLYGDNRANEALAVARADSLAWAQERHDSLEFERDSVRQELEAAVQEHDIVEDSLRGVAVRAENRSRANLGRLAAILADTAPGLTDTVRIVVREAIEGLEEERDVCQLRLRACAETRLLLESRIRIDSTSLLEQDSLLLSFNAQLEDAIANRRRACGLVCWGTRGAALYGIAEVIAKFAGGS